MKMQQMISRSRLCLLAWCTLAVAPTFAQTITHVPLTFHGDDVNFGISVSGAGDVNGDGFADLIVGGQGDNNNGDASGGARVFSGADGSVLHNFNGDSEGDGLGWSVSGAGDVNDDGFADLIIGAPFDDNNGDNSGSARVLSGADGSVLYNFDGDAAFDFFGESVSGAGDVNGDGFADLIVGADGDNNNGLDSGSARVFSGIDGSVLYNFDGFSIGGNFGGSVSGAGDVNGDGFADLIVGARNDFNGRAQVFSGANGTVLHYFVGDSIGERFGWSVSDAGDVNGDGVVDLIVGANNDENDGVNSGSARVLSGAGGGVLYNFDGDSNGDRFGSSVSGAGDVNGDGFDDLIVGARSDDNNGDFSGSVRVFSGVDGSILYNFDGDSDFDRFGESVSGAGDVNGDGVDDFIVGTLGGYARLFVSQFVILGDCNLDGVVNFLDINPFISVLAPNSFLHQADCNQDGVVDFLDIGPFIAILAGN